MYDLVNSNKNAQMVARLSKFPVRNTIHGKLASFSDSPQCHLD